MIIDKVLLLKKINRTRLKINSTSILAKQLQVYSRMSEMVRKKAKESN